jgi:biopolymer transport protein ExbB/TolQ
MILQAGGAVPRTPIELVLSASLETKIVLIITATFSLVSWFIIILKWWQFRRLNRQADRFFAEMERILVELDTVRSQLVSVSASTESGVQSELAADVRALRERVGASAEGMAAAFES